MKYIYKFVHRFLATYQINLYFAFDIHKPK